MANDTVYSSGQALAVLVTPTAALSNGLMTLKQNRRINLTSDDRRPTLSASVSRSPDVTCQNNSAVLLNREKPLDPWEQSLRKLLAMRDLRDDWDGEGSRPPSVGIVDTAINWVSYYKREQYPPTFAPQVMPGTNGEVSLVWRTAEEYLEAEITAPGHFEWMSIRKGHPAEFCVNRGELPMADDWTS
jgi:hypothetical protein